MRRLYVLSRIADSEVRADLELDDSWQIAVDIQNDEGRAKSELVWLSSHTNLREYKLVCVSVSIDNLDDLDDDVPF